jgi:hypothetical protein
VEPIGNHSSPNFPRLICLTDSLIPADTSDHERRKARGIGYPTATRLETREHQFLSVFRRRGGGVEDLGDFLLEILDPSLSRALSLSLSLSLGKCCPHAMAPPDLREMAVEV